MCIDEKCETGCQMFEGGEIKHDKNCFHYPESRTKMYDVAMARISELEKAMQEFVDRKTGRLWDKEINADVVKFKQLLKQGQDGT